VAGTAGEASTAGGDTARAGDGSVGATAGTPETDRAGQADHTTEGDRAGEDSAVEDSAGAASLDDEVTVVPGVARYHRRGCILIRFLSDGDLETMTRREAEATVSVPCKACQPDQPDPSA
jgi:hypothetical protein